MSKFLANVFSPVLSPVKSIFAAPSIDNRNDENDDTASAIDSSSSTDVEDSLDRQNEEHHPQATTKSPKVLSSAKGIKLADWKSATPPKSNDYDVFFYKQVADDPHKNPNPVLQQPLTSRIDWSNLPNLSSPSFGRYKSQADHHAEEGGIIEVHELDERPQAQSTPPRRLLFNTVEAEHCATAGKAKSASAALASASEDAPTPSTRVLKDKSRLPNEESRSPSTLKGEIVSPTALKIREKQQAMRYLEGETSLFHRNFGWFESTSFSPLDSEEEREIEAAKKKGKKPPKKMLPDTPKSKDSKPDKVEVGGEEEDETSEDEEGSSSEEDSDYEDKSPTAPTKPKNRRPTRGAKDTEKKNKKKDQGNEESSSEDEGNSNSEQEEENEGSEFAGSEKDQSGASDVDEDEKSQTSPVQKQPTKKRPRPARKISKAYEPDSGDESENEEDWEESEEDSGKKRKTQGAPKRKKAATASESKKEKPENTTDVGGDDIIGGGEEVVSGSDEENSEVGDQKNDAKTGGDEKSDDEEDKTSKAEEEEDDGVEIVGEDNIEEEMSEKEDKTDLKPSPNATKPPAKKKRKRRASDGAFKPDREEEEVSETESTEDEQASKRQKTTKQANDSLQKELNELNDDGLGQVDVGGDEPSAEAGEEQMQEVSGEHDDDEGSEEEVADAADEGPELDPEDASMRSRLPRDHKGNAKAQTGIFVWTVAQPRSYYDQIIKSQAAEFGANKSQPPSDLRSVTRPQQLATPSNRNDFGYVFKLSDVQKLSYSHGASENTPRNLYPINGEKKEIRIPVGQRITSAAHSAEAEIRRELINSMTFSSNVQLVQPRMEYYFRCCLCKWYSPVKLKFYTEEITWSDQMCLNCYSHECCTECGRFHRYGKPSLHAHTMDPKTADYEEWLTAAKQAENDSAVAQRREASALRNRRLGGGGATAGGRITKINWQVQKKEVEDRKQKIAKLYHTPGSMFARR